MAEFVRIKMDLIHDRNSNILLSLHDSRIKKITFRNNVLILHLNKIFQYTKAGEKIYFGEVLFYDIDLDECSILIFALLFPVHLHYLHLLKPKHRNILQKVFE